MKAYITHFSLLLIFIFSISCNFSEEGNDKHIPMVNQVDAIGIELMEDAQAYQVIATLDHHRMAKAAGVYTPPSTAFIFSDAQINSSLLTVNPLIGLDLPFKFLVYTEADTSTVSIAYTSADFIQKRHQLSNEIILDYKNSLYTILQKLPQDLISSSSSDEVEKDFGIIKIQSDFDQKATIQNLKNIIMGQGDTKWFGEIDYQKEAEVYDIIIKPNSLLLFGGPAPGGKAMMTTPKIGLDAFCQKLLVYEDENGIVWVSFNDIEAFSELYYQISTKPQAMINQRLAETFRTAVQDKKME